MRRGRTRNGLSEVCAMRDPIRLGNWRPTDLTSRQPVSSPATVHRSTP